VKRALLIVVLGAAVTGCSDGGDAAPSATATAAPSVVVTTTPPAGPPAAGSIPDGAFIAAADLGDGWSTTKALVTPCAARYPRTALRSIGLQEQRGTLTETLATGVDLEQAATAWRTSLGACRWTVSDDSLGDAGLSATSPDKKDAVIVTGTEGVLVVLHAHGDLAGATDELDSWADLAVGNSCVAAPDGCH
jgi:hypothetical protein